MLLCCYFLFYILFVEEMSERTNYNRVYCCKELIFPQNHTFIKVYALVRFPNYYDLGKWLNRTLPFTHDLTALTVKQTAFELINQRIAQSIGRVNEPINSFDMLAPKLGIAMCVSEDMIQYERNCILCPFYLVNYTSAADANKTLASIVDYVARKQMEAETFFQFGIVVDRISWGLFSSRVAKTAIAKLPSQIAAKRRRSASARRLVSETYFNTATTELQLLILGSIASFSSGVSMFPTEASEIGESWTSDDLKRLDEASYLNF